MSFFKNQVEHLTDQVFLLNLLAFFFFFFRVVIFSPFSPKLPRIFPD